MWFADRGWRRRALGALGALATALSPLVSRADVYRYISASGGEAYTDCPVEVGGQLILREAAPPAPAQPRGRAHRKTPIGTRVSALAADRVALPVDGVITSLAGLRHDPVDGSLRQHQGIDIAAGEGTPVHPVAAGRVAFSGSRGGYGNAVVVDHGDGRVTLYAHNSANWVGVGDSVDPGDILALSGSTGRSTGPHVHFEMWRGSVNVTDEYLAGLGASVGGGGPAGGSGEDIIRRIIQADGSILFTNLPSGVR